LDVWIIDKETAYIFLIQGIEEYFNIITSKNCTLWPFYRKPRLLSNHKFNKGGAMSGLQLVQYLDFSHVQNIKAIPPFGNSEQ
jgi:hypothetical protein